MLELLDVLRARWPRATVTAPTMAPGLGSGEAEQVALMVGLKPMVRQHLPASEVASVRERAARGGVALREAPNEIVYLGRDPARLEAAVALESRPGHDLELGLLLGYPRCCAESYATAPPPRVNLEVVRAALARTAQPRARLNVLDLRLFHYLAWFPCRLDCEASLAWADALAARLATQHGAPLEGLPGYCPRGCQHERFVPDIDAVLGQHRLVLTEALQLSIVGERSKDTVTAREAWPTFAGWAQRHPVEPSLREAGERLAAGVLAEGAVTCRGGTVTIGGRGLPVKDALLVSFR